MELSVNPVENIEKDIEDLESLLLSAKRDYSKQLLGVEIKLLLKKKELVRVFHVNFTGVV